MSQEVFGSGSTRSYLSAKKIREMKKKALQSYEKIDTIKKKSDKELAKSSKDAEEIINDFTSNI